MKKTIAFSIAILIAATSYGQVLFTYGNKVVTKAEFMTAFDKTPTPANRKDALKEYLELYTNFKLKVQAAKDAGIEKEETFKQESENFRRQIAETYINKAAGLDKLTDEAITRASKDIEIAHIFVEIRNNDSGAARKQIDNAYAALKAGKDFSSVSNSFTTDEQTRANNGNLGFITAFTLPYEIESIVYKLRNGEASTPYRSASGYHIFKRVSDRNALGKRKVTQLLLFTPPHFSQNEKDRLSVLADSIYQAAIGGADFSQLVKQYGSNYNQYNPNTITFTVGVGTHDPSFEKQVFSLSKTGEISKPFNNQYGINIIKIEEVLPVAGKADASYSTFITEQVSKDGRMIEARKQLVNNWLNANKPKELLKDKASLWAFTDSAVKRFGYASKTIDNETSILAFPKEEIKASRWIRYVRAVNPITNGDGSKDYTSMFTNFKSVVGEEYYRNHLVDFNKDYARQVKEFDEANLLFAIMERNVWNKSSEDTAALSNYYQRFSNKYLWQPGVSAIVVTAKTKQLADELVAVFSKDFSGWRDVVNKYEQQVMADSSRYENLQMPVKQNVTAKQGWVSVPELNEHDGSYSFMVVAEVHPTPEPRSFKDARGLVISDYQQELEKQWLNTLKKKYPVVVNKKVWATVK